MAVCCVIPQYKLIEIYRPFRGSSIVKAIALMKEPTTQETVTFIVATATV
jgi:hypothetical protein